MQENTDRSLFSRRVAILSLTVIVLLIETLNSGVSKAVAGLAQPLPAPKTASKSLVSARYLASLTTPAPRSFSEVGTLTFTTPTPSPTAAPAPSPTVKPAAIRVILASVPVSPVADTIREFARQYRLDPEKLVRIAFCESGFNPAADSGPYAGIFQFHPATWVSNRKAMGLETDPSLRYDAREAARTAAFKMSRDGFSAWPVCGKR